MKHDSREERSELIELGAASVETKGPMGPQPDPGIGQRFLAGIADE